MHQYIAYPISSVNGFFSHLAFAADLLWHHFCLAICFLTLSIHSHSLLQVHRQHNCWLLVLYTWTTLMWVDSLCIHKIIVGNFLLTRRNLYIDSKYRCKQVKSLYSSFTYILVTSKEVVDGFWTSKQLLWTAYRLSTTKMVPGCSGNRSHIKIRSDRFDWCTARFRDRRTGDHAWQLT